ncbi:unnamed protein product [Arctogadus glacialis]
MIAESSCEDNLLCHCAGRAESRSVSLSQISAAWDVYIFLLNPDKIKLLLAPVFHSHGRSCTPNTVLLPGSATDTNVHPYSYTAAAPLPWVEKGKFCVNGSAEREGKDWEAD